MSKTMIDSEVVQSEEFNDLADSAQLLYMNLGLDSDNFGIISNISRSIRAAGKTKADLDALLESGHIVPLPPGKLFAIVHYWVNNKMDKTNFDTAYSNEIVKHLCFIGASKKYVLQTEAKKVAVPTDEIANKYVPVWSQSEPSLEPVCNTSKGRKEVAIQDKAISNQTKESRKESRAPSASTGKHPECPECHGEALKTFSNGRTILICGNCGSFQIDPDTGTFERIS